MRTAVLSIVALLGFGLGSCTYDEDWYYLNVYTQVTVVNNRSVDVVARFKWIDNHGNSYDQSQIIKPGQTYDEWNPYFNDFEGIGVKYNGSLRVINRLGVDDAVEKIFDEEFRERGDYSVKYVVTAED